MVVGRRPRQRRVHADVPLIPREGPVDDAPLHGLRDALVALLDALEGDGRGDDLGRDVKQRRRGARPAAGARRTRGHGARSAARRGLTPGGAPRAPAPRAPGMRAPNRHAAINYSFGGIMCDILLKVGIFVLFSSGYDKIDNWKRRCYHLFKVLDCTATALARRGRGLV